MESIDKQLRISSRIFQLSDDEQSPTQQQMIEIDFIVL
jgi:hypothetical protein